MQAVPFVKVDGLAGRTPATDQGGVLDITTIARVTVSGAFEIGSGSKPMALTARDDGAVVSHVGGTLVIEGPQNHVPGSYLKIGDHLGGVDHSGCIVVMKTDAGGTAAAHNLTINVGAADSMLGGQLQFQADQHLQNLNVYRSGLVDASNGGPREDVNLATTGVLTIVGSDTASVSGGVARIGGLDGGSTTLTAATDNGFNAGAQLFAEHIRQTSLTIGDRGKVTIAGGGGASGTSVIGSLSIALPGNSVGQLEKAVEPVPEPGTFVLLAIAGLLGLLGWPRRQ